MKNESVSGNFSVIIPTLNRADVLQKTLESVMLQSMLPRIIYVIDQSDDCATEKLCLKYDLVKYIHSSRKSSTYARNLGIKASETNRVIFFAFIDDDVELLPDYFKNMYLAYLNCPYIDGIAGWVTTPKQKTWNVIVNLLRAIGMFDHYSSSIRILPNFLATRLRECPKEPLPAGWMSGCAMSSRNIGNNKLFDENLIMYALSEDRDYSYRLNKDGNVILDPSIRLIHKVEASGRIQNEKKLYMAAVHPYYLIKKHFPDSIIASAGYWWNMSIRWVIGFVMFIVGSGLRNDSLSNSGRSICCSFCYVYRHRVAISNGDLAFFHKFLEE